MANPKSNLMPRIGANLFQLALYVGVACLVWQGWVHYQSYSQGYTDGQNQGKTFTAYVIQKRMMGGTLTQEQKLFIERHDRRSAHRTWRDKLYLEGWHQGFHAIMDVFPH